ASMELYNGNCAASGASRSRARPAAAAAPATIDALFTCDAGKTIKASFASTPLAHVKLVLSDGRDLTLPQAMSASGARYASDRDTVVFWTKGDTATLDESGQTTYGGCVTKK